MTATMGRVTEGEVRAAAREAAATVFALSERRRRPVPCPMCGRRTTRGHTRPQDKNH
jgi:hypothetical protein